MSWRASIATLGEFQADVSLAGRTTLGVGGHARWLFRPGDEASLVKAMVLLPGDVDIFPLGRGSNLLVSDDGIDGLVIDLNGLSGIAVSGKYIVAKAGARMGKIAQIAASAGLAGVEFMATVPGDLGGGVAMNAGAFGQQVSDVLVSIQVLQRDGKVADIQRQDLHMVYRWTDLPEASLVLSARLCLKEDEEEAIKERMRLMRKKRSDTQPLALPNCGSVFKNPEGDYAARLIESVGLKGKKIGHARISDVHANFIVNEGGASCADVLALIRLAKHTVLEQCEVVLQPEVRFVGCAL